MRCGDVGCEVAFACPRASGEPIDGLASGLVDDRVDVFHRARCEHTVCDLAVRPVFGWIHRDDRAHRGERAGFEAARLFRGQHVDAWPRRESVRRRGDVEDVGVLRDGPEGFEAGWFAAMYGGLGSQASEELVRWASVRILLR